MARAGNQWFCEIQYFSYEEVFPESIALSARALACMDQSRALSWWFIPLEGIFFPDIAGTTRTGLPSPRAGVAAGQEVMGEGAGEMLRCLGSGCREV